MWRVVVLVVTAVLAAIVACTPIDQSHAWVARDAAAGGHHIVSGVETRDPDGHPYVRYEIRDLFTQKPDQFALFLLGLREFQAMDQSDPLSYYRIAAIHSEPYEVWQEAYGPDPTAAVGAYCPHNSRLFLPWHRPYLTLFEKELWKHVRSIADSIQQDHERWSAAADAFRLPYWDTSRGPGDGNIPDFLINPEWSITGPNGSQVIENPLFRYQFHPLVPSDFDNPDIARYNQTIRWPTSHYAEAKPQMEKFMKAYKDVEIPRLNGVHDAFGKELFSNLTEGLEGVHGWMHNIIGGWNSPSPEDGQLLKGHMTEPNFSAFDPSFWLHHANYDRLFALYTTANPDVWIIPQVVDNDQNKPTFWIPQNSITDANTQLLPFWKDENTFYTSEDVRRTDIFGYAYPETQYWKFASEEDWRNDVRHRIQDLYPNSARVALTNAMASDSALTQVVEDDRTFTDWVFQVGASGTEMPSSFRAMFSFVGESSSDEVTELAIWQRFTNIPEPSVWKARQAERKAKRPSTIDQDLSWATSVTSSLLSRIQAGKLNSLDPEAVVPYLKAHLRWNVYSSIDSEHMTSDQLDSFTIEATSRKVRIPEDPSHPLEYISGTTSYPIKRDNE